MAKNLQERTLSLEAKQATRVGRSIAKENRNTMFTPVHLLKALLHKDAGLQNLLGKLGKDLYYIEEWTEVRIESVTKL